MFDLIHYLYAWVLSLLGIQDNIGFLGSMWKVFFVFITILVIIGVVISVYAEHRENKITK